ncbi:MAG: protein translocase SEC61 complex subunit gamma [Halobacteria archaeon]|nr:protein translocase SEC61 complex subunit gamma [Halobacteria archaeon]
MVLDISLKEYIRVLKLARTPGWDEFTQVAKIAGAGILLIGLTGFAIFVLMSPLPP